MNPHRKLLVLTLTVLAVTTLGFSAQASACTVVVSATADSLESGQLLLAALAGIEQTPCLLRIEPGDYDLAGSTLVMRDRIDVEGSGRDVTTIRSTGPGNASLVDGPAGVTAEIRDLRLLNKQADYSWAGTLGIHSESMRVTRVDVEVDGIVVAGLGYAVGVGVSASAGRLEDLTIHIELPPASIQQMVGLYMCSPPNDAPAVRDVRIELVDSGMEAELIFNYGIIVCGNPDIDRVDISMTSARSGYYLYTGIFVTNDSSVNVSHSTIHVVTDPTSGSANGIQDNGGSGEILLSHSEVMTSGFWATGVSTQIELTVEHSTIEATTASISHFGTAGARVGASRLAPAVTGSGFTCAASYGADFTPLSETCQ